MVKYLLNYKEFFTIFASIVVGEAFNIVRTIELDVKAVSYTHLTLPTKRIV